MAAWVWLLVALDGTVAIYAGFVLALLMLGRRQECEVRASSRNLRSCARANATR